MARILGDGTRRRTRAFTHLQSHYLFRDRFGRPGMVEAMHAIRDELEVYGWCRMQAALGHRG